MPEIKTKFQNGEKVFIVGADPFDYPTEIESILLEKSMEPRYKVNHGYVNESDLRTKEEQLVFIQAELVKFIQRP